MYDVTYHIKGKYLPERDSVDSNNMDNFGDNSNYLLYLANITQDGCQPYTSCHNNRWHRCST